MVYKDSVWNRMLLRARRLRIAVAEERGQFENPDEGKLLQL
jgi:hypothetical protein